MNIYLDIDGVILTKEGKQMQYLKEFLLYVFDLAGENIYWLSTHCKDGNTDRVLKSTKVNTHIYYHCCRSKDEKCREPYITEDEMINQLISLLPQMKLDKKYLLREFNDEIKRVNNMRLIIEDNNYKGKELTPHNGKEEIHSTDEMIKNYLLHILQFGNPQERIRISEGIKSKFILSNRNLMIDN